MTCKEYEAIFVFVMTRELLLCYDKTANTVITVANQP